MCNYISLFLFYDQSHENNMIYNQKNEDQQSIILTLMNSYKYNDNTQSNKEIDKCLKSHTQSKSLFLKVNEK